jgi:hypothetical protein
MSIASKVAKCCEGAQAYTLSGGYALHDSGRVLFPAGSVEVCNRNKKGRVTYFRIRYSDGSALAYTYRTNMGGALRLTK